MAIEVLLDPTLVRRDSDSDSDSHRFGVDPGSTRLVSNLLG